MQTNLRKSSEQIRPQLLFRSDASQQIGLGHIMRCTALAQAWREHGGHVTFLSHCESDGIRQRIQDNGFEFVAVAQPHPDPSDLEQTLSVLSENTIEAKPANETNPSNLTKETGETSKSWVVLDGYHFTPDYQEALRKAGFRLLVIDDIAHQSIYHAEILLNQNIEAEHLEYKTDPDTVYLLGTKYALLRKEFLRWRGWEREISRKPRKILVTMGGADPNNVTLSVLKALKQVGLKDLAVKVVVGPANLNLQSLQGELTTASYPVELLNWVKNMPSLMAWADIGVSAAGSTCWELAFMGLPSLIIVLAENQHGIASGLEKAGAVLNCGWFQELTVERFVQSLLLLIGDEIDRSAMCARGGDLVDGMGAERIVGKMTGVG